MSYDLPTDLDTKKIFDVRRYESDCKLTYVPQNKLDEWAPDPSVSSGLPYYYTLWADAIKLWPVPDSGISIYVRYIKNITALADNTTTTVDIPAKYDDVVINGALTKAYLFDNRPNDALVAQGLYNEGLGRMILDNKQIVDYNEVADTHGGTYIPIERFTSPAGQ